MRSVAAIIPVALALALAATPLVACRPAPPRAPASTPSPAPAGVPGAFRALYVELEAGLDGFSRYLGTRPRAAAAEPILGAEILPANGNRGPALLAPATMDVTRLYLDRLQSLGAKGASVQVAYPLLDPSFPRSNEYLEFFRQVGEETRRRGLKLLVETGPVFPDPEFSQVRADFSRLTKERYFADKRRDALLIAREVRPDYLSLGNEPATEKMLTGLDLSLDDYLANVKDTLSALDRSGGMLVGAGAGTWEDPRYVERFARETSLDFIDLHLYPLSNGAQDYLRRAAEWAALARAHGKRVVVGEAWLYKAAAAEIRGDLHYSEIFARDPYSFWQPLDRKFLAVVFDLARREGFDYVSFFWSQLLFSYLDYTQAPAGATKGDLYHRANQGALRSLRDGMLSETGQEFTRLAGAAGGGPGAQAQRTLELVSKLSPPNIPLPLARGRGIQMHLGDTRLCTKKPSSACGISVILSEAKGPYLGTMQKSGGTDSSLRSE